VLLLVAIVVSLFLVVPASAARGQSQEATWFRVTADNGEYLDLDADGAADDIVTTLSIHILCPVCFDHTDVYCYLCLPSGDAYLFIVTIIGTYTHIEMDVGWYNVVTDSGWYTFIAYTEIDCGCTSYWSLDSLTFDPPTEGNPGPPVVGVLSLTVTL